MLASYLAMPREGHMHVAIHVMSYLKSHHNSRLVLDPCYSRHNKDNFIDDADWTPFYGDVTEAHPPNAPKPLGKGVELRLFVDSDHAGDKVTRRSRTGYIVFLQNSPITWFSKKQSSVETSTFGSEFMAMKTATEYIRGLRYKR